MATTTGITLQLTNYVNQLLQSHSTTADISYLIAAPIDNNNTNTITIINAIKATTIDSKLVSIDELYCYLPAGLSIIGINIPSIASNDSIDSISALYKSYQTAIQSIYTNNPSAFIYYSASTNTALSSSTNQSISITILTTNYQPAAVFRLRCTSNNPIVNTNIQQLESVLNTDNTILLAIQNQSTGNKHIIKYNTANNQSPLLSALCTEFNPNIAVSTATTALSTQSYYTNEFQLLLSNNNTDNIISAPILKTQLLPSNNNNNNSNTKLTIDVIGYSGINTTIAIMIEQLIDKLKSQLKFITNRLSTSSTTSNSIISYQFLHFHPIVLNGVHSITLPIPIYSTTAAELDELDPIAVNNRLYYHSLLYLPIDRPLFRLDNSIQEFNINPTNITTLAGLEFNGRLLNIHLSLSNNGMNSGISGTDTITAVVQGNYLYYHYLQDGINDSGWGCAYRTLQTIISWYILQLYNPSSAGYTVPTHQQIQSILVECGDKDVKFINSREWIGAIELGLVLQQLLQQESRTLFISSGDEISQPQYLRQLLTHFQLVGTPVMIGGGVLAYGLLGISWNSLTNQVKFLILDPHYTGGESITTIIKSNWCSWKTPNQLFHSEYFYNFCLPQRPKIV